MNPRETLQRIAKVIEHKTALIDERDRIKLLSATCFGDYFVDKVISGLYI